MCGIAGFYSLDGKAQPDVHLAIAWAMLSTRGVDASGAMWRTRTGGISTYTEPKPSLDIVTTVWPLITVTPDLQWVALHSRAASVGLPDNPKNNHPVAYGQILLTHNGAIYNAPQVFSELHKQPQAQVDTEAIAAALSVGGIKEVVSRCRGSMALAWADRSQPGTLHLYRNDRSPLWVSVNPGRWLVYASDKWLVPKQLHGKQSFELKAGNHLIVRSGSIGQEKVGTGKAWSSLPLSEELYNCYGLGCPLSQAHKHRTDHLPYSLHTAHGGTKHHATATE